MVRVVQRCLVEDGEDEQGQSGDALHGQQQEGLHAEVLALPVGLQPLQVLPEHGALLSVVKEGGGGGGGGEGGRVKGEGGRERRE